MDLRKQFDVLGYDSAWEFPRSNIELISILGSGAFGEVWLAEATGIKGIFTIRSAFIYCSSL